MHLPPPLRPPHYERGTHVERPKALARSPARERTRVTERGASKREMLDGKHPKLTLPVVSKQLKPNILDEINNDPTVGAPSPPVEGLKNGRFVRSNCSHPSHLARFATGCAVYLSLENICSDTDTIVLEDESGRVTLSFEGEGLPQAAHYVTGAVMAILGLCLCVS